jgi:formylglycine-generating enzyme required for sulfatase activity
MSNHADEYPSAALLAELRELRYPKDRKKRSLWAWKIVTRALPNSDYYVVVDHALENGLILPCDTGAGPRRRGPVPSNPTWVNPLDGSEMVWVPPGPFCVGTGRTRAECKGFSLARFPVTNAQFERFLHETGYEPPPGHPDPNLFLSHWTNGAPPKEKLDHPAVFVSHIDALYYCQWAGLTLPTEWLWEKAARGPEGRDFPWGGQRPRASLQLANVFGKSTCAVGSYPRTRTPYGCEDMIGNVSEWCQMTKDDDFAAVPPPGPIVVPSSNGAPVYAAVRGSCFMRTGFPAMVSSHRRRLSVTRRNYWTGFRPALLFPFRPTE